MVMLNSGGKWIKVAEVNNGDILTFKDEGSWQENTKYKYPDGNPKMDFVIGVAHNGEEKQMRLNGTNRNTLSACYGKDTAKWVGKSATINKVKALVGGKQMEVILLEVEGIDQLEAIPDTDAPF
jgi:hypothetical protein